MEKLASEKVIVSAPTSFAGSSARIWRLTNLIPNLWVKWLLLAPLAFLLVVFAWVAVAVWYCFFGLWLVPWRLLRRGHRKNKKRELQHRELMDAVRQAKR